MYIYVYIYIYIYNHTLAVNECLTSNKPNPILRNPAPDINPSEQSLPRKTRRILAQLRADKSPILKAYLHEIDSKSCPSAACPLCNYHLHNTQHLFSCPKVITTLTPWDLIGLIVYSGKVMAPAIWLPSILNPPIIFS